MKPASCGVASGWMTAVVAALAAYLRKAGAEARLTALYTGAGAAILASLVAAWLFHTLNNGAHNDIVEGVVILAAAAPV